MEDLEFQDFLRGLRAGEPHAAEYLNQYYREYVCQCIRPLLARGQLRRISDSVDICQSVFMNFVQAMKAGRYPLLQTPDHLGNLLKRYAKNECTDLWRRERHVGRDGVPRVPGPVIDNGTEAVDDASSPS